MKKLIAVLVFYMMGITSTQAQSHLTQKLEEFLKKTQTELCPDRRTSIFDIKVVVNAGNVELTGETTAPEAINKLNEYLKEQNISAENLVRILPGESITRKYGLVTVSTANLRKMPEHAAELVSQALLGTVLRIYKIEKGWALVQTPDNYLGWMEDDGLVYADNKEVMSYLRGRRIIITTLHPYCYSSPSEKSETVSDLTAAAILSCSGKSGNWYRVTFPDGRKGYVKQKDASDMQEYFNHIRPTQQTIISTAKRFLGTPYLWGGSSAKGLDCSGFTKTVYFLNGMLLSRDASQQVLQGTLVDSSLNFTQLQPGDVTFYGRKTAEGIERTTHVGIYLGEKQFIHSSGRVRINSYDPASEVYSEYRTKSFLRAKRFLTAETSSSLMIIHSPFYFPVQELQ